MNAKCAKEQSLLMAPMTRAESGADTVRNTVPMPFSSTMIRSPQPNTRLAVSATGLYVSQMSAFSTCCAHTSSSTYQRTRAGGRASAGTPHRRMPQPSRRKCSIGFCGLDER